MKKYHSKGKIKLPLEVVRKRKLDGRRGEEGNREADEVWEEEVQERIGSENGKRRGASLGLAGDWGQGKIQGSMG